MAGSGSVSAPEEKGGDVVDKRAPEFSVEELVQEIAHQLAITDQGMTTREICDAMNLPATTRNMAKISQRIRDMIVLGQAEFAGKKQSRAVDGGMHSVSAWRLKPGGEGD